MLIGENVNSCLFELPLFLSVMSKINEITKLNQTELENDIPFEQSWHQTYKNCPWVFFGGLSTELSEGDIICMFSQSCFICFVHCIDGVK